MAGGAGAGVVASITGAGGAGGVPPTAEFPALADGLAEHVLEGGEVTAAGHWALRSVTCLYSIVKCGD